MIIITLVTLELNSNVTNVITIYIFKCERTLATLDPTQMLLTFSHTLSTSNSFDGATFARVKNPKVILALFFRFLSQARITLDSRLAWRSVRRRNSRSTKFSTSSPTPPATSDDDRERRHRPPSKWRPRTARPLYFFTLFVAKNYTFLSKQLNSFHHFNKKV